MNKYYNINDFFDENGEPIEVNIEIKNNNQIDYKTAYETTFECNKILCEKYNEVKKQNDDAVEYINKHFQDDEGIICKYVGDNACNVNENFIDELLKILGR